MDTPPPESFSEDDLLTTLNANWDLEVDGLRYVPKGAGSYHWVLEAEGRPAYFLTVDDLDDKPWIADERAAAFEGLGIAYETARSLQDTGLSFVVGPIASRHASVTARLSDQYSVAVFPFVAGVAGQWGDPMSDDRRKALVGELARLHAAVPPLALGRRSLDLPERAALEAALNDLDNPWSAGPFAEPARRALADRAESVSGWLTELDDLAASLQDVLPARAVVTHGEPHPGNLITTDEGFRLVDWDTVAVALPERDLWMLDGAFEVYEDITGTRVSRTAVGFYGLAWTLSDIASFTAMWRSPHAGTQWREQKWNGFLRLLAGERSTPYG